ncbi:MAG TPA: DNRLRE domain-containing protein [Gammaproteobacteria bacterium]|nr:DNRLRE domain-containing protein [Gammaproteobacteria bacterium]
MFIKLSSTFLCALLAAAPLQADMVHIPADRDATLIEDPDGATANGAGPAFFAGRNNQGQYSIRRAVIHFDVAENLPEQAIIDRAFLSLYQTSGSNVSDEMISLHRVLQDWSEGPAFSSGGGGAPSEPGDVTWLHTRYDLEYWLQEGGHFIPHASSTERVGGIGFYTWQDSVSLVNDVRLWLHAPQQNFGWLVMGNEDTPQTSKRFASREGANVDQQPLLTIEYHLPGD